LVIKIVQCNAVISCSPTFGMYKFLSNVLNVPFVDGTFTLPLHTPTAAFIVIIETAAAASSTTRCSKSSTVPRDPSFNVDAAAVAAKVRELGRCIVYLASPNNPTGNCLSKKDFLQICASDCVVVLDEAYAEFAQVKP
jgi:histidinol-phosphate/aromatic aminotransferase/cobyric acid decarboxylase-like protein